LDQEEGERLTTECKRVLKPGGIIRIAIPDLEKICQDYLLSLQQVDQNIEHAELNALWMRMELFDQMTRKVSGGKMLQFLQSNPDNKEFLIKRCGKGALPSLLPNKEEINSSSLEKVLPFHLKLKQLMKKISDPSWLKEMLIRTLVNKSDYEAFQLGRFQQSGELHKHMYDRISMKELLQKIGFVKYTIQSHLSSLFPQWKEFYLDNNSAGEARKPDSLFLEAIKPE
jgi:hypothetical protein